MNLDQPWMILPLSHLRLLSMDGTVSSCASLSALLGTEESEIQWGYPKAGWLVSWKIPWKIPWKPGIALFFFRKASHGEIVPKNGI